MSISYLCSVWGKMINTLRGIPDNVKIWLYIGSAILMLLFLWKAIKVNFNAKNEKKMNFLWFLPVLLLAGFIWMLSI